MPRKSVVQDTEWDIRITFIAEQWKLAARTIKRHSSTYVDDDNVIFLLVSGVEYGVSNNYRVLDKSDTYHVHAALVLREPCNRESAVQHFIKEKGTLFTNVYAVPRKRSTTYMGWVLHHTKLKTKDHSTSNFCGPYMVSIGDCPTDAPTVINKRQINVVTKGYAIEQAQQVKEILDGWVIQREQPKLQSLEERAAKRRLYERAYRATELQKSKREVYDRNRRWKSYMDLVNKYNNLENKNDTECLALYKKIKHLESTRWINEAMQQNQWTGIPPPDIHDINSDEE